MGSNLLLGELMALEILAFQLIGIYISIILALVK